MITLYYKSAKDVEPKVISDFKVGSWIYVENPNENEITRLVDEFKLEQGLIKDALDPNEIPRMEVDEGIVYLFTRVPATEEGRLITAPIMVAIAPNFIVTVASREFEFLQKFVAGRHDFSTTQKAKLLVQIFSDINIVYRDAMAKISKSNREMKNRLSNITNKDIIEFVRFEEILNDFLSVLTSTNTALNNLLYVKVVEFYESDKDLIEDMFLSNSQVIESCTRNLKRIKNIREAYSTIMTQDLNRTIKILTVLTILLNVPVLVASLYGMNVPLPGAGSPLAFWWVLGGTAILTVLLFILFLRNKLL